ncbi:MAG: zinc ribbon domain-containing protein [Gammaproteobacteria bacterium]|nr:zinc ribbon domain-containing protein [Gammaproteobacteria bacterium]
MPIYEYSCTDCDHNHEALQKLSDDPLLDCPACGQSALKKMISAPRFRLSGSGWYETDFKSDKQRNLADSGSKKEPDSKPEKPAEKKETSKSKDAAA